MKQLPFNILISALLLMLVFLIASTEMSYADASTTPQMPGLAIDGMSDGRLQLHGSGFRPGALVNLELKQRTGQVSTGVNVWVDAKGSFVAEFNMTPVAEQVASLEGGSAFSWDDWIVVATASTGSISVPLKAGNLPNQEP